VYLLGAVLHEILTGDPPHDGPTMEAIVASVLLSEPRLPDSVPPEAARICRRAMSREHEDRHPSAEAFRAAIEDLLRHRGSHALSEGADASRARPEAAIAAGAPEDELYDLLGECRFGYRAALASWDGNAEARVGLSAALSAMAEHALVLGDPHGASRLVRELGDPPVELARRVVEAERAKDEEQRKLTALQRELDPGPGSRTRVVIAAAMGALWVSVPAATQLRDVEPTYGEMLGFLSAMVVLLGAFGLWARASLRATLINQRVARSLLFVLVAQAVMDVAGAWAGAPVRATMVMFPVLWSATLGTISIWFEPRFWPSAILGLALVAYAMRFPLYVSGGFAVFNLAFVINIAWAWLPRDDLARAEREVLRFVESRHGRRRRR
jgi:serine/threonine-protein kinase